MDLQARIDLLEGLVSGDVALRDIAGLGPAHVQRLAAMGRASFESGAFEQAALLFATLETLEGDEPEHAIRLAHSLAGLGDRDGALRAVDRYLARDISDPAALVGALVLRASLVINDDRDAAMDDLKAAHVLADAHPAAREALEAGGR